MVIPEHIFINQVNLQLEKGDFNNLNIFYISLKSYIGTTEDKTFIIDYGVNYYVEVSCSETSGGSKTIFFLTKYFR